MSSGITKLTKSEWNNLYSISISIVMRNFQYDSKNRFMKQTPAGIIPRTLQS